MRRIREYKKYLIFLLPFIFYIWGINYGLPLHLIGDEESLVGGSLLMIQHKQFIPALDQSVFSILYYPPIIPYLLIIANIPVLLWKLVINGFDVQTTMDSLILNMNAIWISSRLLAAAAAAGGVVIIYKLSKLLYKQKSAWLAASLFALSFQHVMLAHSIRHWAFAVFFTYLLIMLALLIVRAQLKKRWLLGIAAGIGFGVHNIVLFGFLTAIIILIYHRDRVSNLARLLWRNITIFVLIGGTLTLFNFYDILRILAREQTNQERSIGGLFLHIENFFHVLWTQEMALFILGVLSVFYINKRKRHRTLAFSMMFLYALFVYIVFHFESRYIYLIIPALAIIGADALYNFVGHRKRIYYALSLIFLFYSFVNVLQYNKLMTRPDTRELAISYIEENINGTFVVSSPLINLERNKTSLEKAQEFGTIDSRERYILSNYDRIGGNLGKAYDFQNIHFWSEENYTINKIEQLLSQDEPEYFVVDYWTEGDLDEVERFLRDKGAIVMKIDQGSGQEAIDFNGDYRQSLRSIFRVKNLGPTVEIIQL